MNSLWCNFGVFPKSSCISSKSRSFSLFDLGSAVYASPFDFLSLLQLFQARRTQDVDRQLFCATQNPMCAHSPATRGCMKDYYPDLTRFDDVARHYLQNHASKLENNLKWFASPNKLSEVIERTCASVDDRGRLHSHQWPFEKIRPEAPKQAVDRLKPLANRIEAARNFDDDLYPIISINLASVSGIGPLARYDFALRIGAWFHPKLEPTAVYLHCGTSKGARAVSVRVNHRERAPMSDFPEGLRQSLTAAQMEDALCIYCGTLARIAGNSQGVPKTTSHGILRCVTVPVQPRAPRPGCY
jgi:hypothetical protein